jgi:hypothetical protein
MRGSDLDSAFGAYSERGWTLYVFQKRHWVKVGWLARGLGATDDYYVLPSWELVEPETIPKDNATPFPKGYANKSHANCYRDAEFNKLLNP